MFRSGNGSNNMGRQSCDREKWINRLQDENGYSYLGRGREHDRDYPPLPLMENGTVLQEQPDQAALTERYVAEAVRFMREQKDGPFFLYFAHMYVHLPLYVPQSYIERSQNGRYGAAVEHVDWSVAVILDELKRLGIDEDTCVIFTSDNGSRARDEGGSNAPLRGTKGTTWEGGQRLPCIVRWPGVVPADTVPNAITASIDFLPTFAGFAGEAVQQEQKIDGMDIGPLLRGEATESGREEFCYFHLGTLEAMRIGKWKLHQSKEGKECCELYDLESDIGETNDVAAANPDVVARISARMDAWRKELGDRRLGITGSACRPIGRIPAERADTLTHYDPTHPYIMAEYDLGDAG